jgi:hypothetical protein
MPAGFDDIGREPTVVQYGLRVARFDEHAHLRGVANLSQYATRVIVSTMEFRVG